MAIRSRLAQKFLEIVGNELIVAIGLEHVFRVESNGLPVTVHYGVAVPAIGLVYHHQARGIFL